MGLRLTFSTRAAWFARSRSLKMRRPSAAPHATVHNPPDMTGIPGQRRPPVARLAALGLGVVLLGELLLALVMAPIVWVFGELSRFEIALGASFLVSQPLVTWVALRGRMASSRTVRAAQGVALGIVVAAHVVFAAQLLPEIARDFSARRRLGFDGGEAAVGLGFSAVALGLAASCVALARHLSAGMEGRRRAGVLRLALGASLACLSIAVAGTSAAAAFSGSLRVAEIDCRWFRFDSATWRSDAAIDVEDYSNSTKRQRITESLIRCRTLHGMSKARVRQLLGPANGGRPRGNSWSYLIGPDAWGIDSENLTVEFSGERGRVRSLEVWAD